MDVFLFVPVLLDSYNLNKHFAKIVNTVINFPKSVLCTKMHKVKAITQLDKNF